MFGKDAEETARLLHMEQLENDERDIPGFNKSLKEMHPELTLGDRIFLWTKYRGMDARPPSHDPATGRMF